MPVNLEILDQLFYKSFGIVLITVLTYLGVILVVNHILTKIIQKSNLKHKEQILKTKRVIVIFLIIMSILSQFTFMESLLKTLLAGGGIVAVAVGLASQQAASSVVSGFMIFVTRPFKVGDTVVLKEYSLRGKVKEITLSHTVIETLENNQIMIPNVKMNSAIIENLTHASEYKVSFLTMSVSYESDLDQAIEIMKNVIQKHPLYYPTEDGIFVHCTELGDSGINLRAKITTLSVGDGFQLCSDCRMLIKKAFDEAHIEIPYPHLVVETKENIQ